MPLQAIPGLQAFENIRTNGQSMWTARGSPEDRVGPLARPMFHPRFSLAKGDKVFTIGSCFAREIEPELDRLGFEVPMLDYGKSDDPTAVGDLLNFGAPSILNELEWALDPQRPFDPATGLIEVSAGGYCDLHLTRLGKATSLAQAMARRARIGAAMATAAECRVIIITLGLVEVWWDAVAGRYLNIAPPKQMVKKHPERFSLHVLSADEVGDHLDRALRLLLRFGRADHRVLLTVSPVPLGVTFTGEDVMVANAYSKSVLRTVAQALWRRYDHVDYYPSYESVTLSERGLAFEDDNRHVRRELIKLNIERMVGAYTGQSDAGVFDRAVSAEKARDFALAVELFRQAVAQDGDQKSRLGLARSLRGLRRFDEALAVLDEADADPEALVARARTLRFARNMSEAAAMVPKLIAVGAAALTEAMAISAAESDPQGVERACDVLAALNPRSSTPFQYRGMMRLRQGRPDQALALLEEGVQLNQNSVELFVLLGQAHAALGAAAAARDAFNRALTLNAGSRAAADGLAALEREATGEAHAPGPA